MNTKYQVVLIGFKNSLKDQIIDTLKLRVSDLGISTDSINIIEEGNFHSRYIGNSPTVGLYYGGNNSAFPNLDILPMQR